ncbi:MAG: hypothetical protein ACI96P_001411 [Candidatus Azotimanducaceae bacterium]|jgi:hypothetical protein
MRRSVYLAMFCTLTTLLTAGTTTVFAALPSSDNDRIMATLQGYEWQLDFVALNALPPSAWRDLLAVVDDNAQPTFIRERAAASLVAFPNDEVLAFYVQSLSETNQGLHRGRQVESLCLGFARQRPLAVEQAILPLLKTTEGQWRLPAARCLQSMGLSGSQAALTRYREQVADTWEGRALSHALQQE